MSLFMWKNKQDLVCSQVQSLLQIFWRLERSEQVLKLMSDKSYERRSPEMFFYKFKEET
jgi:hypothetical protein